MSTYLKLDEELNRLQGEAGWTRGHTARTLIKQPALRVVLIALKPDAHIDEHQTEGPISIHVLHGRLRVGASGESFTVEAGHLLVVEAAVRHDVHALEESAFLLTIGVRPA